MLYQLFIIITVSLLPFIFSLNGEFVFDDSEAIVKNKDVTADSSINVFNNDFWGTPITSNLSHKSYRPLTVVSFRLNYLLSGHILNPLHFKIINLVCHMVCCIIIWYSFKAMVTGANSFQTTGKESFKDSDFLAALVFAVHPVHTEAVCGIVGRADIIAAIAYFSSFLFYHSAILHDLSGKRRAWFYVLMSLLLAFASMLFKENGITVLGFCLIYELTVNPQTNVLLSHKSTRNIKKQPPDKPKYNKNMFIIRIILLLATGISSLLTRWIIMGKSVPQFKSIDNPAAFSENILTKVATYNYLYFINFLLFFWPQWLCFDWSMGCIPLLKDISDYRIIFILTFYCYLLFAVYHMCNVRINLFKRRLVMLGFASMIVPFLPASNVFLTVGFVLAERILYIPSAGYCLLFVIGFKNIFENIKAKKLFFVLYVNLILIYAMKSSQRAFDWQNEYSLFTTGLNICPLNAKVHYNVAKVADAKNHTEWSLAEYREAIRLYPEYYQAMNNLANLLKNIKEYTEAEKYLKMAISYKKDFPAAWMNWGIVLAATKRYDESEKAYLTAIEYRNKYPDCFYNLGNLYLDMKRTDEAMIAWNKAIELNPKHVLAWSNLLALLDNTGQIGKVLEIIPVALNELPQAPSIHFVAANMYGKIGRYEEAEKHFSKTIKLFDNRVKAIHHANFGVLYHRWKKYKPAEEQYKKALKLDPHFKNALSNIKSVRKLLYK